MAKVDRDKFFKNDKIVVKNVRTGKIRKLIFPHEVDFGLENFPNLAEKIRFYNGLSGSLTHLADGRSYIAAGAGVTITSASNGQILIAASAGAGTGDIQGVTAGTGLSGGGTTGTVTLNLAIDEYSSVTPTKNDSFLTLDSDGSTHQLTTISAVSSLMAGDGLVSTNGELIVDINELTAADINVAEDFIAFSDEGSSGDPTRKESIGDFMAAVAGTGIAAASGVLSVDLNQVGAAEVDVANDSIVIIDANASNATKKESISDFVSGIAGTGISATDGVLSVASLAVAQGGTGATSFTDKAVVITQDSGTDALAGVAMASNGQLLIGGTSGPAVSTLTAGTNISISNADGGITITASGVAPGAAGSDTHVQFNDGGSTMAGDSGLLYDKTANSLYAAGVITASLGFTGSLTKLLDGTSYIAAGENVTITSASNGQILISSDNSQYGPGNGLDLIDGGTTFALDLKENGGVEIFLTELAIDDSIVATLTGSNFTGPVSFSQGITGSLTKTSDGKSYLAAGNNVTITSGVNEQITIASTDTNTEYTAGTGLDLSTTTFSIDDSIVATISGSQFKAGIGVTGSISTTTFLSAPKIVSSKISGSLTRLIDGKSYIVGGTNVAVSSASNGQITLSATNTEYTAGNGLDLSTTEFSLDLKSTGGLKIESTELTIDDSIVATVSGANFQGNVGATGSIGATLGFSGSLTRLTDGSSYLRAGTNVSITSASNGGITISSTGGAAGTVAGSDTHVQFNDGGSAFGTDANFTFNNSTDTLSVTRISSSLTRLTDGSSYLIAGDNISITTQSNGSIVITGSAGGSSSSTIGTAEDGDYTDGLFADFTSSTTIGIAVDRINEVLKSLAPSPAPDLDDIDSKNTGTTALLSFGASNDQSAATPAYASVSTAAGSSAVDVNGSYTVTTSSNNIRLGVFDGDTHVSGVLNADVISNSQGNSVQNYPEFSFANGDTGVLRLNVNGTTIKEIDFTTDPIGSGSSGLGSGSHLDSNGSGFNFFSTATTGTFSNGNSFASFVHRTGQFVVSSGSQRRGWNYARVLHVKSGSTSTTNYIEWVNDDNSDALAAAGSSISFEGNGSIHLSGIEYFLSGTGTYKTRVTNAYKYVYDNENITFSTTSGSLTGSADVLFTIAPQAKPSISGGETHAKVLHITGSGVLSGSYFLSGALTGSVNVSHPFKSNLSQAGSVVVEQILLYSSSNTSTNQFESFQREDFRIVSGAYDTQASLINTANIWTGSVHMSASNGNHSDGLQFFGTRLVSPLNTIHNGNFSGIQNAPNDNPDYSAQSGQRTFYRWFKNETGSSKNDLTLVINGSGTIVTAATSLNASRIRVFVKFPSNGTRSTGWLDLASEFVLDSYDDNDGAHTANGSLSFDSSLTATNYITLGTIGVANNEYIGIRIEADAAWSGHIDTINVAFGAGTGTITAIPDLDDIDCNDDGTDCNLSFGSSKAISGYTSVAASAGIGAAVDVNGLYETTAASNNLRRSVFALDTVIEGDLNEDVPAVSPDYVANSFSDANSGSLVLEVNGSDVHSVELTGSFNLVGTGEPGSGTGTSFTSNSGFFDLSVWRPAEFDNDVPYFLEIYRTGKYRVHTSHQRKGWNYARVKHIGSWGTRNTNYVEWVNDDNNDALSAASVVMTPFEDDNIFHLSGVKYFIQPSGSIEAKISNLYKNVYSDSASAISFTNLANATGIKIIQSGSGLSSTKTTSSSTDSLQTLTTTSNSEQQDVHISGSVRFSQSKSLSGSFTTHYSASGSLVFAHPLKTNLTTTIMTSSILQVYSASDNSNANTVENFNGELFRIQSGSYGSQANVISSTYNWSSTGSLNDNSNFPGFYTGLMLYDSYLISPLAGGNQGDFRNYTDGGVFDSPSGNVNYSSLGVATREYYRGFLNNTTNDLARITIVLYGDATIVSKSTSLGTNKNIHVELKIPGKTGFLDLGTASAGSGNISDGDGCLFGDPDSTVDGSGATNVCTFNGTTVDGTTSGAEYFVIKLSAHKNWTGYISQIAVTWSG